MPTRDFIDCGCKVHLIILFIKTKEKMYEKAVPNEGDNIVERKSKKRMIIF